MREEDSLTQLFPLTNKITAKPSAVHFGEKQVLRWISVGKGSEMSYFEQVTQLMIIHACS